MFKQSEEIDPLIKMQYFYSPPVGLIDELPLGDPNSLGSDLVSQKLFDTQVEFIQSKQGLAHLPYKLSWPPDEQKNLANLAGKNSKIGESCRYELKIWRILPI